MVVEAEVEMNFLDLRKRDHRFPLAALHTLGLSIFESALPYGPSKPGLDYEWRPPMSALLIIHASRQSNLDLIISIITLTFGLLLFVASIFSVIALPVTLMKMNRLGWVTRG